MPLSRYQIRNEYSLADPELYLAADKDDPEALLEGVAMAGLVGVLRQLGDLSEFAAEIFHQLHEEVMATAARGHGLMTRVQQLESEIPSIEKAFLSQTSHSSLYYNAGLDWHANLCMDQNLITQGDLPQFVMDSYEECRGPPRLFILDKFDVAGAGSCLKRYTNPSFFKVEAAFSGAPNVEIQRDKKIRKVKKKGARKRNGETPEILPTSTVKLHQLFLEERIENGSNDPARLVKLKKRQLNGSRFDSQTKQSYMQKLLQTSSPEHRVVHEISTSPPLNLSSNSIEPVQKILDIQTFDVESPKRSRSRSVSPIARETILQPSTGELSEEVIDGGNLKVPTLDLDNKMEDISSRLDEVVAEKEFAVDRESKAEGSVDGSSSDDLASETDNFMDALNTLESEIETDTECRPKNDLGFFNVEKHGRDSDANEEQLELQAQFSDSQSIGYSNASDVGIISLKKEASSFPYSDLSCLAENTPSDADGVAEVFPSTENRIVEYVDTSSDKLSISDEILGTKYHEKSIPNGTCTEVVEVPNPWAECGEAYGISNSTNSNPTLPSLGLGANSGEVLSVVSEQDVTFSDNNELDTSRKNTGDILSATDNLSDIPSLKNIVPAVNHPADDLDDVDSNIFTDALLNLSNDSVIAPENNRRKIGVNEVLQTGNAEDTSHKIFHSDSLVHLPSDSDPFPDEKNCRENVGDEVLQTKYADDASLESIINKNIGSPLLNVLSTEKKFLNSNLPELEPPSGITPQLNYLSASTAHCPDAENPDNIVSELVTISAAVTNSEDSTPVVNTPQSSSFSEQKFSKRADDFLTPEIDSAEVGGLHSGERKDSEGVCRTKDFEEIEGSTSSEDGMESVLVSSKFSSEYPNHASPKEENMVTGTAANIPVANIDVDSDADNLSQDIPCSLSTNSISMQESLSTFGESHQKVLEIQELSPPYCLIKSDAQEEVNQPAGSGDSDSLPLSAVSCEHSNLKPPNDVPELSLNLQSLNNLPNPDATKSPISSMQISQRTEFPSGISGPSQIDKDQKVLPIHDFTSSPISSKEKEQDIGPDSLHQTNFSDDSKSAGSLPTSYLPDPGNQFEQAMELQADQLSMECVNADNTVPKISILLPEQIPDLNHIPQERCFSAFTESSLEGLPGQASMSESSLQSADIKLESSEQAMAPSASVFPSLGLFPQASQISLEEMPPLPPLPPMQWRIGKSQHPSLASARQSLQEHSLGSFPPILPSTAAENAQSGFLTSADIQQPQNPFLPPSDVKDEKSQHISEHLAGPSPFSLQIQTMVSGAYNQQSLLTLGGGTESLNPFLPLPAMPEIPQDGFLTLEGERTQLTLNPFSLEPPVETQLPVPLPENLILPPNQQALEKDLVAKKFQDTSQNLEEEKVNSLEFLPPSMVEDEQPQHGLQIPGESTWSSYASGLLPDSEKGKPNGDLLIKVPRPRNPLIDAVAAHDKSKLRKVIERARPQIEHKDDERNSLLEQIRTKSFNLKPSIVTRPSIQGPKTNLRVAAILEKANAIRQAFAGSDEDDDDNWSDS